MQTIQNIVEQHPKSVAQLFSMYGIDKAVTAKNLAAAVVIHKGALLSDLENLIGQNGYDDYEGENYEGTEGYSELESADGRRWRIKNKWLRKMAPHNVLKGWAGMVQQGPPFAQGFPSPNPAQIQNPQLRDPRALNQQLIDMVQQRNGSYSARYETPEIEPVSEEEIENGFTDYFMLEGANGKKVAVKEKKERRPKAYGAGGVKDFDSNAARRKTSDILDTIGKVGTNAANIASAMKPLFDKNGNQIGVDAGAGGAPSPEPSKMKKYLPWIIGGVAIVVIGIGVFLMTRKK